MFLVPGHAGAAPTVAEAFDDTPRTHEIIHPTWFKNSFLDLRADLAEAANAGKLGVLLYFGQANCVYCERLIDVNFNQHPDIAEYTQKYFDVIALDIWGQLTVTTPEGRTLTEWQLADEWDTQFTPSLIFLSPQGQPMLRLRGYYSPYWFRAALDYVVGGFYREETFAQYQERTAPPMKFDEEELNPHALFSPPPYLLNRAQTPAARPLVVFFEQNDCHACDILHSGALRDASLLHALASMEAVQLNRWSSTPLVTPSGETTTARAWGDKLAIFYTPTLVFFNEHGQEIFRVDSVAGPYRLRKVVDYIVSKGYAREPFQRWHTRQLINQ